MKNKILRIITLILIFCYLLLRPINAHTQSAEIDSLKLVAATAKADSTKIIALNRLAHLMRGYNLDSTITLAQQSLELGREIDFISGQCNAYYYLSVGYVYTGQIAKALPPAKSTLSLSVDLDDLGLQSRAHNLLGAIYRNQYDTDSASYHIIRSAEIAQSIGDLARLARAYASLGHLWLLKNPDLSESYYLKAREIAISNQFTAIIGSSSQALGVKAYNDKKDEKALKYFRDVLDVAEQMNDMGLYVNGAAGYGEILRGQGHLDSAMYYLDRAEKLSSEIKLKNAFADIAGIKAATYKDMGRPAKAVEYYGKLLSNL